MEAEAAGEIRSIPVYVQSRPVYQKPTPKPKPKLILPKQLQNVQSDGGKAKTNKSPSSENNPNLVTQTVYGFLDFVTTIGNTVMVFTPQTKKGWCSLNCITCTIITINSQPMNVIWLTQDIKTKESIDFRNDGIRIKHGHVLLSR